eukprot:9469539-Pyramimonas_sp.AAC.1
MLERRRRGIATSVSRGHCLSCTSVALFLHSSHPPHGQRAAGRQRSPGKGLRSLECSFLH